MPWRWAWSITGLRRSPASSKIRRNGTSDQEDMSAGSIRFSFRVRCTAWRATCTRCSSRHREPVRADLGLAEEASAEVEDFQAEDLAAVGAARFNQKAASSQPATILLSDY